MQAPQQTTVMNHRPLLDKTNIRQYTEDLIQNDDVLGLHAVLEELVYRDSNKAKRLQHTIEDFLGKRASGEKPQATPNRFRSSSPRNYRIRGLKPRIEAATRTEDYSELKHIMDLLEGDPRPQSTTLRAIVTQELYHAGHLALPGVNLNVP